jgi:hypothetical protein
MKRSIQRQNAWLANTPTTLTAPSRRKPPCCGQVAIVIADNYKEGNCQKKALSESSRIKINYDAMLGVHKEQFGKITIHENYFAFHR